MQVQCLEELSCAETNQWQIFWGKGVIFILAGCPLVPWSCKLLICWTLLTFKMNISLRSLTFCDSEDPCAAVKRVFAGKCLSYSLSLAQNSESLTNACNLYWRYTYKSGTHIFSLQYCSISLYYNRFWKLSLHKKNRDRKWRDLNMFDNQYIWIMMMAFCKSTWWAIFVGGSELPNLTLWHDMPTILNGVSASRPTFTNLPTFSSV